MSDLLETYLRDLRTIRLSGVALRETSSYPPLANLLNGVGNTLRPKVHCIIQLSNRGAGYPDGGLFTPDQLRAAADDAPLLGQIPARGVIEVKGTGDEVADIAASDQVLRYVEHYGQVLVTNYRAFVVVTRGTKGLTETGESYALAPDESSFWAAASDPRSMAAEHGERFLEYLRRMLLLRAPLAAPKDVAFFLASYARDARSRIEGQGLPGLVPVRQALEQALGLRFEGEKGEHFFRSTLVQTLFYGVFSAWVLWSKQNPPGAGAWFSWKDTMWTLRVPAIRVLYEQVATASRLERLGLTEVLDWAEAALNRVDRASFFARFEEDHAVQYFYEPFLEAFDPQLRKELGVWYTPSEVVEYMVERVDTVLREELGIAAGLADPRVYVLDPCTGTGSYLVAVLKRIATTLREQGGDALTGDDLKRAAMERIAGFEILPAPFVVAHLQLGLLLQNLGTPLSDEQNERAGVYLTNALTGWEPPAEPRMHFLFPELEEERDAAEHIKRDQEILVIIGNPPYNGYAGVAVAEERELTDAYRVAKATKQPQGQGLNDLYVRFYRMAERRIVEMTGRGVVSFISNYSWLDGLSFTAMRERYLEVFDRIWIDSLNGDKYKTGKLTPEGEPDPSIFSTEWNREGIQVGTAISLLVRNTHHRPANTVHFRNLWGRTKRAELVKTAHQRDTRLYEHVTPTNDLGLPFLPMASEADYLSWPLLPDLFPVSFPGVKTSRDDVLVDIDRDRLVARMERYFDLDTSHDEMRLIAPGAMEDTAGFNAVAVRDHLRRRGFLPDNVVRYAYRPFDIRWLYWEPEADLLDRKREEYFPEIFAGNAFLFATGRIRKSNPEPAVVTHLLSDLNFMDSGAKGFPLSLRNDRSLFDHAGIGDARPNLSAQATAYIEERDVSEQDLFHHCLSLLNSPAYRHDNKGALRHDWPRVPMPVSRDALVSSSTLGRQLAALFDTEMPLQGVTTGTIRPELRQIAAISREGGGNLNPSAGDLAVTAGWGRGGNGRPVMPGRGKAVQRPYTAAERTAIEAAANPLGLSLAEAFAPLGEATYDVYLNDIAFWQNVPERVWTYTLGGYQVIKKWLSYREAPILGRDLTPEEAREVQAIARRIAAILLLEPELDANYRTVTSETYPWPKAGVTGAEALRLW